MKIKKPEKCFICNKLLHDKTEEECCFNAFVDEEQRDEILPINDLFEQSALICKSNNNIKEGL